MPYSPNYSDQVCYRLLSTSGVSISDILCSKWYGMGNHPLSMRKLIGMYELRLPSKSGTVQLKGPSGSYCLFLFHFPFYLLHVLIKYTPCPFFGHCNVYTEHSFKWSICSFCHPSQISSTKCMLKCRFPPFPPETKSKNYKTKRVLDLWSQNKSWAATPMKPTTCLYSFQLC